MRTYELMLVLRPDMDEKDTKKLEDLVKKLVSEAGATLSSLVVMGKRKLYTPMRKQTEGLYLLAKLEGNAVRTALIDSQTKLGQDVLRYLLIVKE